MMSRESRDHDRVEGKERKSLTDRLASMSALSRFGTMPPGDQHGIKVTLYIPCFELTLMFVPRRPRLLHPYRHHGPRHGSRHLRVRPRHHNLRHPPL